jgi:hypothetical protein
MSGAAGRPGRIRVETVATPNPAPAPARRSWEVTRCAASPAAESYRDALMRDGWEPFAVSQGIMWFRRLKP